MKTITVKLYEFSELSPEAQQKALSKLYDINVSFNEWYEGVYEDAKTIGLKITAFDIDRGNYCEGEFIENAITVADLISENHGETCGTYRTALQFHEDYTALVEKYSDGVNTEKVAEGKEDDFDCEADILEAEFLKSLLEDYKIMLSREWDYLTSDKAIIETIEANAYTFEEDGTMNNG